MGSAGLPNGTVTFVLTDIEGSTAALHRLGDDYPRSLELHRELVRREVAAAGGVEVDSQGDSFLFAFARADAGIDAAGRIVSSLARVDWPHGVPLVARVGVHTGDVEQTVDGYVGLELHRAARIAGAAHGGQVVLSATTRALGGERRFLDLGHHRLKDFDEPERLFQLLDPGDARFPPLRTRAARPLPEGPGTFVGRGRELGDVGSLFAGGARLVTLIGAGGVGKSRLALEAARLLLDAFPHGVHLVRLAPLELASEMPTELAASLGVAPGSDAGRAVVDHLRERRLLLVLDNLEHVQDEAAALVAEVLRDAPGVTVLGTSRSPLRIAGEHVIVVEPLGDDDATALFAERAHAAGGRFVLDEATARDIRAICHRIDGLPLAIEIIAARVTTVSISDLARGTGFSLQTPGVRDAPDHHRTLDAAITWGIEMLDDRRRDLHASLAVFQSRFTPAAAAFTFGADIDDLDAMVKAALLRRVEDDAATRLAMLQTVRDHGRERLAADGRLAEAQERRAAWIEDLAERAADGLDSPDARTWQEELAQWAADIRVTLREAAQAGDHARCIRVTSRLERFWRARGEVDEARRILAEALAAAQPEDHEIRARASWTLARLATAQGDARGAREPLTRALELYREAESRREVSFALTELAWGSVDLGELDLAEAQALEALEVAHEAEDDRAAASALAARATVLAEQGDAVGARAAAGESLALRRRLGRPLLVANAAVTLASAALAQGDLDAAEVAAHECLALALELGDVLHEAVARCVLGEIEVLRGESERATGELLAALATFVRVGNTTAGSECLIALAATRPGTPEALRLLEAVASAREQTGVEPGTVERLLEAQARVGLDAVGTSARPGLSLVDAALLAGVDPLAI